MLQRLIKRNFSYLNGFSYVHGTSTTPLQYKSIGQKLFEIRDTFPQHTAVVSNHQNIHLNYQQLVEQAEHVAAALKSLGLKKHDRVGIYSMNNYQWVVTQFAASLADLILVNINPAYQRHELQFCLKKVNVKALITASSFKSSNYIQMINDIVPELANSAIGNLNSAALPDLKFVIKIDEDKTSGMMNFNDLYDLVSSKNILEIRDMQRKINPDDPTNIQFTSGTTGSPKGATLSHFNILNNGLFIGERMLLTDKDKVCIPVPLYHCFGMVLGNMACINRGAAMIYPNDSFNSKMTLEAVSKNKCTGLYGVPTMFIEYFKEYEKNPKAYDISHLRTGIMAGTLCPQVLMEKVINIFNMKDVTICYGMTETSPVSFQTNPDDNDEDRCGTVGTSLPHVESKIINDDGQIVPINTPGELCVRGYLRMSSYFNDADKTKDTIDKDGWLYSGDLAQMDQRGYLKIVGRKKDMIIRGGENVYPREIEEFLLRMPGIKDINVVGVPDEKFGEEIFAYVILNDENKNNFDIQNIYQYCHGQISHYKIPKFVKIVENFPLTISGKVQKFKIQEQLKEEIQKDPKAFSKYSIRKY